MPPYFSHSSSKPSRFSLPLCLLLPESLTCWRDCIMNIMLAGDERRSEIGLLRALTPGERCCSSVLVETTVIALTARRPASLVSFRMLLLCSVDGPLRGPTGCVSGQRFLHGDRSRFWCLSAPSAVVLTRLLHCADSRPARSFSRRHYAAVGSDACNRCPHEGPSPGD